ncbi:MAG TPA: exodeoxyribonuclease VII large subunit [Steroidobacteraceae bacterium]
MEPRPEAGIGIDSPALGSSALGSSAVGSSAVPAVRAVYSVSRLNREARTLLESGLGSLWVQGEISNLARPSSGHWYFSLKDRDAQLRCAMFRQRNTLARFAPKEGQLVLCFGRVSLYEPRGDYQLLVELIEDAGLGALQRAFDELKARLAAEGLFAPERKRPLPPAPRRIGLITSPTGAAVRDILHVLARRYPVAHVLIYPAPVQGAAAVAALVAAIELAAARAECDVLILARGGGSLEDLWAFNDERLARAILRCPIPVVTGVGHEIDFTIADFVADLRAPTPSAAAHAVVPDAAAWLQRLEQLATRFAAAARRSLRGEQARLDALLRRLRQAHPGARLLQHSQRLDELESRLRLALRARIAAGTARLDGAARALQAVSPLATLSRGFAVITRGADGALVTASGQLAVGEQFDARLAEGSLRATVLERRS